MQIMFRKLCCYCRQTSTQQNNTEKSTRMMNFVSLGSGRGGGGSRLQVDRGEAPRLEQIEKQTTECGLQTPCLLAAYRGTGRDGSKA